LATEGRQKTLGKDLRGKLMSAMPSLNMAIKAIHKEARQNHGTIAGLDGRRLYVRAKHAALNLRLQSDGALIAKKWCLLTDDLFYNEGWDHHVEAEYAFCSWSHDEIQVAVREDLAERAAELMEAAAPMAGEFFNFHCPVAAEAQIGNNWAETH
jgi:DNA polymerase I-like protein with 3'-5' exonuclease and polymerase domains